MGSSIIAFCRVKDWWHLLGITLAGSIFAFRSFPGPAVIAPLAVSALFLAYGYSMNQLFDLSVQDAAGRRCLPGYRFSFRSGLAFSLAALGGSLAASLTLSRGVSLAVAAGAVFGWLYSAPPVRAKRLPLLGLAVNSLCFLPLFPAGSLAGSVRPGTLWLTGYVLIALIPFQLIHELEHREADAAAGIRTTALALGERGFLPFLACTLLVLAAYSAAISCLPGMHMLFPAANILFCLWLFVFMARRLARGPDMRGLKERVRLAGIIYGAAILAALLL